MKKFTRRWTKVLRHEIGRDKPLPVMSLDGYLSVCSFKMTTHGQGNTPKNMAGQTTLIQKSCDLGKEEIIEELTKTRWEAFHSNVNSGIAAAELGA